MSFEPCTVCEAEEKAERFAREAEEKAELRKERSARAWELAVALRALGCACTVTWAGDVVILDPEVLVEKFKEVGL